MPIVQNCNCWVGDPRKFLERAPTSNASPPPLNPTPLLAMQLKFACFALLAAFAVAVPVGRPPNCPQLLANAKAAILTAGAGTDAPCLFPRLGSLGTLPRARRHPEARTLHCKAPPRGQNTARRHVATSCCQPSPAPRLSAALDNATAAMNTTIPRLDKAIKDAGMEHDNANAAYNVALNTYNAAVNANSQAQNSLQQDTDSLTVPSPASRTPRTPTSTSCDPGL